MLLGCTVPYGANPDSKAPTQTPEASLYHLPIALPCDKNYSINTLLEFCELNIRPELTHVKFKNRSELVNGCRVVFGNLLAHLSQD